MEHSTGIKVETQNDFSLKTTPLLTVNMENITVEKQTERKFDAIDKESNNDFQFLADPKKMKPKDSKDLDPTNESVKKKDNETDIASQVDYRPRYSDKTSERERDPTEVMSNFAQNSGFFTSIKTSVMTDDD